MSNVFHYRKEIKDKSWLITCRIEFPTETYWFGYVGGYEAICHVCGKKIKRTEMLDHLITSHHYVVAAIQTKEPGAIGKENYFVPSLKLNDIFEMDTPLESVADLKSWDQKQLFEHYLCVIRLHLEKLDLIKDLDAKIELQGKIGWMLDDLKVLYLNK